MSALQRLELVETEQLQPNLRLLTAAAEPETVRTVGEAGALLSQELSYTYDQITDPAERTVWLNQLSAEYLRYLICADPANEALINEIYPVALAYFLVDNVAHEGLFRMCAEAQLKDYLYS